MMSKEQSMELSTEVIQYEALKEPMMLGDVFSKSGMFPDVKSQAQAVVKILAGKELGVSPFEAMTNLYMVSGRLAIMAKLMASIIKKGNKYDYSVDELTDNDCKISFYRVKGDTQDPIGTSTFTIKDAAKAGLVNKDNWKNYPRNMLFARALSNGARWYCPDAVGGYYTMEELEDVSPIEPVKEIIKMTEGEVTNG